jgi:pilus assembly protein Flp/PilA
MPRSLAKFLADERGATAVEYAMIAIMISIVIVAGATSIGTKLSSMHFGPLQGAFN